MRITEILASLPNIKDEFRQEAWFTAENYYPVYNQLGMLLNPESILEIGTRLGLSLLSLLDGAKAAREVAWIDDESCIPHSNQRCVENLKYYFEHFSPVVKVVDIQYATSKELLYHFITNGKKFDVIHIDGDHSYKEKIEDLNIAQQLGTTAILLNNYSFSNEVRQAINDWARLHRLEYAVVSTYRGMAIFDLTPEKTVFSTLVKGNIQFEVVKPELSVMKRCWCGGALNEHSVHPAYDQCENCGTLVCKEQLSEQELTKIYACHDYWYTCVEKYGFPNLEQRGKYFLEKRVPRWYELLTQYSQNVKTLLEIGCAEGSFLWYCKEKGIPTVVGIEVDEETCAFARKTYGLEHVYAGLFPNVSLPFSRYDAVCAFDVLEHFRDPLEALRSIKHLLQDDGILIIQTPVYRNDGENWIQFKPHEHLNLFNYKSLRLLFDRTGFDVVTVEPGFIPEDSIVVLRKKIDVDSLTLPEHSQREKAEAKRKTIAIGLIEHFGDILACEPVVRYLRYKNPSASIVWCMREPYVDILKNHPFLDEIVTVQCLTEWIELKELAVFDSYYDLHIHKRVCPVCKRPLEKDDLFRVDGETYLSVGNLLSAFSKGASLPALDGIPKLYIDTATRENVDKVPLSERFVVLHTTSNELERDWHKAGWAAVVSYLTKKYGFQVVEVGTKSLLSQCTGNILNLCGRTTLLETAEIIRRATVFLGVESGPAHLAYAMGTPSIVLLGAYRTFQRYLPYSKYEERANLFHLLYSDDGPACNIRVDDVLEAIDRIVSRDAGRVRNAPMSECDAVSGAKPFVNSRYPLTPSIVTLLHNNEYKGFLDTIEGCRSLLRVLAHELADEYHRKKLQQRATDEGHNLALESHSVRILLQYGLLNIEHGDVQRGLQLLTRGLMRAAQKRVWEQVSAYDKNQSLRNQILEYFENNLQLWKSLPEFSHALALFMILEGYYEKAVRILESMPDEERKSKEVQEIFNVFQVFLDHIINDEYGMKPNINLIGKAEEYIQSGEYEKAEELLQQQLVYNPDDIDALNDQAIVRLLRGDAEGAQRVLKRVLELDATNEIALENLRVLQQSPLR